MFQVGAGQSAPRGMSWFRTTSVDHSFVRHTLYSNYSIPSDAAKKEPTRGAERRPFFMFPNGNIFRHLALVGGYP